MRGKRNARKELPLAALHRLIKKAGAQKGLPFLVVSESGADELRTVLENLGVRIAKEAIDYCTHAGRKTVRRDDVSLAAEKLFRSKLGGDSG